MSKHPERPELIPHPFEELLPGYALGSLSPTEIQQLESHLSGCKRCRERLRWFGPAVDVIPASVEQLDPPPGLKASLMTIVRAEAVESQAAAEPAKRPWWRGGSVSLSLRPALAMGAFALFAAGAVGYALNSVADNGGGARPAIAARTLVDAVPSPNVRAAAVLERTGEGAVLHVERLPALSDEDVYELWIRIGEELVPSATFVLAGDRTADPQIAKLPAGAEEVLVTREPDGGSQVPSTEPVLSASLS